MGAEASVKLHHAIRRLQEAHAATAKQLSSLTAEHAAMKSELSAQLGSAEGRAADLEDRLTASAASVASWEAKGAQWETARSELATAKAAAEETLAAVQNELSTLRESAGATEESQLERLCQVSKEADTLRRRVRELAELKAKLAAAEATSECAYITGEGGGGLVKTMLHLRLQPPTPHLPTPHLAVGKLREDVFVGETARRGLHNQLQELKGNVRVLVRVRPFLAGDAAPSVGAGDEEDEEGVSTPSPAGEAAVPAIRVALDGTSLEIAQPPTRSTKEGPARRDTRPLRFEFDTVLGPTADQGDVFAEVQHLVQSALDGYNVCIFS